MLYSIWQRLKQMTEIRYGYGPTEYGPGVSINLTGDEIAIAIDAWLVAHGIHIRGPRTITVNGGICEYGQVYVDPSGFVVSGGEKWSGRGVPGEQRYPEVTADEEKI
jgi:hypothetical protein